MNNDDAQTIVLIVILLVCLAAIFFPLLLFFVYVFFQTSKRKRIREKMLATHQQLVGNRRWLPVRYASEPRFKSWFKIFPWEGAGILVLAPGSVLFLGETNSGSACERPVRARQFAHQLDRQVSFSQRRCLVV